MTTCGPFAILKIETRERQPDGTTKLLSVNLLSERSGFCVTNWQPATAQPKAGGTWRDSSLAHGRRLAMRKRDNIRDSLTMAARNWNADALIRDTQDLRRLLEKAFAYWTSDWQDEPVWILAQGVHETNARYTVIADYSTPRDGYPYGGAFWQEVERATFDQFPLELEHEDFWRADEPGTGTCVEASGTQEGWAYEGWILNTAQPANIVRHILELQSTPSRMLAADQNQEIWRTDTGGAVWTAATTPPTIDPMWMAEDVTNSRIYVAGATGCWRSVNGGVDWVQRNAVVRADTPNSLIYASDGYLYLANVVALVVQRSNDQGATWAAVLSTGEAPRCVFEASDGYIYSGDGGGYIYRTSNGTTWNLFQFPLGAVEIYGFWEPGDGYLYAGLGTASGIELWRKDITNVLEPFNFISLTSTIGAAALYTLILASNGYYYLISFNGIVSQSIDAMSWKPAVDIGNNSATILEYSGNSYLYAGEDGDIWYSNSLLASTDVGRTATCDDEIYIANKRNMAQLTHVWNYIAAPPAWTNNFPGVVPFNLLPNPMANGDAIVLTIDSNVLDSGPFNSAIFDISRPAHGIYTLTWYYPSGGGAAFPPPGVGWTALNLHDRTYSFQASNVCGLYLVPPADWTEVIINGIAGHHIVGLISGVAGNPQGPEQDNRDVYTANWPDVDIDALQVPGDIGPLLQIKAHNRSDEDGPTGDELDLYDNRVIIGARSASRGSSFVSYLNCSDEQNPFGVTVTAGANTVFADDITAPTGRRMTHTTDGTSTWADECTFTLGPSIARDFYGSFHTFFRANQAAFTTAMGEIKFRLQIRTGSGGITYTSEEVTPPNLNFWQLLDFQSTRLPATSLLKSSELTDETSLVVQIWSSAAALVVRLYDLINIPTDEWAGDFVDQALEDDSGVTNGYLLGVDSVTFPKRDIRALVKTADEAFIRSSYQPITPAPATLQANADQQLHFLTARGVVLGSHTAANGQAMLTDAAASFLTSSVKVGQIIYNVTDSTTATITGVTATTITGALSAGTWDTGDEYYIICANWRSEPWNCHSVQLVGAARYLSMRGDR